MKNILFIIWAVALMASCKSQDVVKDTSENKPEKKNIQNSEEKVSCEVLLERHLKCFVPPSEKIYNIPVNDSPYKGNKDAPVTVIEFTDFQCPACKGFALKTLPDLVKEMGTDVRVVFKHYPLSFHKMAFKASEAAIEVRALGGDAAFWKFHDTLFSNQDKLDSIEYIYSAAKSAGVDETKVKEALDSGKNRKRVQEDIDLGNKADVEGTPWVYINGKMITRESPENAAKEALVHAKALIKSGTAPDKLYSFITDHGKSFIEKPIEESKKKRLVDQYRKPFLERCKQNPDHPLIKIYKSCSKPGIKCKQFMDCFNQKFTR